MYETNVFMSVGSILASALLISGTIVFPFRFYKRYLKKIKEELWSVYSKLPCCGEEVEENISLENVRKHISKLEKNKKEKKVEFFILLSIIYPILIFFVGFIIYHLISMTSMETAEAVLSILILMIVMIVPIINSCT